MSDFMSRDIMPEVWNDILSSHWSYFNAEESIEKLEIRKKLEGFLKEFLCIVQPQHKFILSETGQVLKQSIQDIENFSAQKAINAFEAINQYANNIFIKPWRKEFRILKMYSGYYQHEINSNLLDAEKLFEAMGYRRLSENTLILDGPICPDQVTNVSRDAMTAYVELKIIKHIGNVLDTNGIKFSWWDIFLYREKHTGGILQAIKGLTKAAEEKFYRSREKALANDNYGYIDVEPPSNYLMTNYKMCPVQCHCLAYRNVAPPSRYRPMVPTNGMYCLPEHNQSNSCTENCMYTNMSYPAQHNYFHYQHKQAGLPAEARGAPLAQMSHSRSLEHYSEPIHHHNALPHRHSFDHQQQGCTAQHQPRHYSQHYQCINHPSQNYYESPYDCIDGNSLEGGSSTISYAAVAASAGSSTGQKKCNMIPNNSTYTHPYNVSGNRFPLPLNISNQFPAYETLQESKYNGTNDDENMHSLISRQPQNCGVRPGIAQNGYSLVNPLVSDGLPRQRSHQTEQLMSFDDSSSFRSTTQQYHSNYDPSDNLINKGYAQPSNPTCHIASKSPKNDDMHVYAKPMPKESRKPLHNLNHPRNSYCNSGERCGDAIDISHESTNDDLINLRRQNERNHLHSPTQFTKNQDGVGSFESWNYVFQNLERSGYSKDLGNREELLLHSLDLDALNINNDTSPSQSSSIEKIRSNYAGSENQNSAQCKQQQNLQASRNSQFATKNNTKMEILASSSSTSNIQRQKALMDNNEKKIKSALKQTNPTSNKNNPNVNKAQPKNADNKSLHKTLNNNNDSSTIVENDATARKKSSQTSVVNSSSKRSKHGANITSNAAPTSSSLGTQIIVTGANEWSCTFCTFINPNTKRICEMCCRTKDNKLDASTNSTATGTNAVAHNTTTCA